jgi:DNA replication protein DnaC
MPFCKHCPPCFEDTAFEQLPCPRLSILALEWQFGAEGLNLWGYPGTGKTRTISLLLKSMHAAGHSIICFGPGGFRAGCIAHNHRRPPWLDKLSKVDLLFIDDMDKMNLTKEQERDLFEVLTNRMGRKPVLLTGNASGKCIEYHFRLGEAMVRRIRDHCLSIHFAESDIANPHPKR